MDVRRGERIVAVAWLAVLVWLAAGHGAQAHPMGNFSISHYARLQADGDTLYVRYILDLAEIPTVTEKEALDADHDGVISPPEKAAYLAAQERQLRAGVTLTVNGRPVPLHLQDSDLRLSPGAGGLETMKIFLDWQAPLPPARAAPVVAWADRNYPDRTGWKEIIAVGGAGDALQASSAATEDRSQGLSVYPRDVIPPQDTQARFTVVPGSLTAAVATPAMTPALPARDATPRDAFTQAIARHTLTPGIMLAGLLLAFLFGAFHALSPGHGKTMVAAYLVGSRGTPRHAVALGTIVTVTHTFGVFLLGFITLFAARYIVPEKLYPVLSVVSGLSVFGVGLWLLWSRLRGLSDGHSHDHHSHDLEHTHSHDHEHGPDEIHLHEHTHDHEHGHTHDHEHSHGFGHHHHHHVPDGPITTKALVALGVSGGIVPCPSALVVLLSAIALHRVAYGLLLISAFSVGLASVLVAIGLLVVSARRLADRFPSSGPVLQRLPLASAAAITLIGLMLVVRAFTPGGF
ncbi:MAG: sulfite exporter TauE/SafE family protein [Armatimonadetes bacterium]|nr:sulfite exporter TauE/SafE family protein [Armatimonadota bacterium]